MENIFQMPRQIMKIPHHRLQNSETIAKNYEILEKKQKKLETKISLCSRNIFWYRLVFVYCFVVEFVGEKCGIMCQFCRRHRMPLGTKGKYGEQKLASGDYTQAIGVSWYGCGNDEGMFAPIRDGGKGNKERIARRRSGEDGRSFGRV
jgi:hypothetical protein